MIFKILTIVNLIILIYIMFRMRDYDKLVNDKKQRDFLEGKKRQRGKK